MGKSTKSVFLDLPTSLLSSRPSKAPGLPTSTCASEALPSKRSIDN